MTTEPSRVIMFRKAHRFNVSGTFLMFDQCNLSVHFNGDVNIRLSEPFAIMLIINF